MGGSHERLKIKEGKRVTVETHVTVKEYPLHWHSFFEIEIILDGEGDCKINDVVYDMSRRNVFLLTSTDFHYLRAKDTLSMINISFNEELLDERDIGLLLRGDIKRAYHFDDEDYKRLVSAAELLRSECESDGDCQRQLLQYILSLIMRRNSSLAESSAPDHLSGVRKAIIYMGLHFREKITLEDIAAEAGYHPTYFSEVFKKSTGETYIDALTKLRVGSARTMLTNGFSVSETCFASGFGSLSGFAAAFKKICRVSPGEYKKMYGKG